MPFCYTPNVGLLPYAIAADIAFSLLVMYFLVYLHARNYVGKRKAAVISVLEFFVLSIGIFKMLIYTLFSTVCI